MKKIFLIFLTICVATLAVRAQTNTNAFLITPTAAVTVQPAITVTTLTVARILVDAQHGSVLIWFVGVPKPYQFKPAAAAAIIATMQTRLSTAIAAGVQANPPTQ